MAVFHTPQMEDITVSSVYRFFTSKAIDAVYDFIEPLQTNYQLKILPSQPTTMYSCCCFHTIQETNLYF